MNYVLAVHGGAGTIREGADEQSYHAGLRAALSAGEALLRGGGNALDAVVAAVAALENSPLFNAGHGAVFGADGTHQLDAGVMDGNGLRAGAVAAVCHVRNPILAARAVLDDGRYVVLAGEGGDRFAEEAGLAPVANEYFSTPLRREQLRAVQASDPRGTALDHSAREAQDVRPFGTVGAVALDSGGHLAAATSTGGMTNKHPGRIGDTPLVGAGVYANDATCAVSATGTGEHFIRACVAHDIHARMAYGGASLADAANAAVEQSLTAVGGEGGVIALGRDGTLALPFNSRGMYRGWVRQGEDQCSAIFHDEMGPFQVPSATLD